MKKIFFLYGAALIGLAACSGNKAQTEETTDAAAEEPAATEAVVYEGTLPAADCDGIVYNLALTADADDNGTYELTETYLTETPSDPAVTKGTYTLNSVTPDGQVLRYYALTPDGDEAIAMCFVEVNDSTITMVGEDFVLPDTPGMNYSLTKK